MAIPNWLSSEDRIVGANHPVLPNTKDRCGQTIYTMLGVEHDDGTGHHDVRSSGVTTESGTFSGTGATKIVTLSNANLTIKDVAVWQLTGSATGPTLVSNGTFDTDTTGWTGVDCTLSQTGTGGQSGGYMGMLYTGAGANFYAYQLVSGLIVGVTYTVSGYFRTQSTGTTSGRMYVGASPGSGGTLIGSGATTTSWQQISNTWVATATSIYITVLCNISSISAPYTHEWDTIVMTRTLTGSAPEYIEGVTTDDAIFGRDDTTFTSGLIYNISGGSFTVGSSDIINKSGETNYWFVHGIDTDSTFTGDSGAGSDPDWIASSTANRIVADGTGTLSSGNIANYVESQIWTQFTEEHGTDGTHSITLASTRIETYSYAGNDGDARVISLSLTDLDIKYICIIKDGAVMASKTEDMSGDTTKVENIAAFQANYIEAVGTGSFAVGTGLNASGSTYIYIAIGV